MKHHLIKLIPAGLLASICISTAQVKEPPQSIEALIAKSLSNNPEIAVYQAAIDSGKAGLEQAGRWSNPELNLGSGLNRISSGAGFQNGHVMSVSLSQRIEFPQRIQLRKAIANGDIKLAELGLERFRMNVENRIREAAYAHQSSLELMTLYTRVSDRAENLLQALVQRDPAGVAPLLQRRVIEALLVQLHLKSRGYQLEAERHLMELNYLAGNAPDARLLLAPFEVQLNDLPSAQVLHDIASTNNFELAFHAEEISQQGYRVELAKSERWSELTLEPFFERETGGGPQNVIGLGISLPLPIWNRNKGNIKAAEIRETQLAAAISASFRQIQKDLSFHAQGYKASLEQVRRW